MNRYERLRHQGSHIWRKRRRQVKKNRKDVNIRRRNTARVKIRQDINTPPLKNIPLLQRIVLAAKQALLTQKKDDQHQKKNI